MTDPVLTTVAPRLRDLRTRRDLTLTQVAETTGISVSTLSRLESGGRKPTLELLLPLARAYRVPLDDLVGAPATGDPRIHPEPVRRGGSTYIPLNSGSGGLVAIKQIIPVRRDRPRLRTHDGYEWVYVLAGRIRLTLGERDFELGQGEAAEFDTRVPHAFAALDHPAELLHLFGPQGERVHLRTSS